jgi:hypothetical protein
MNESKVSDKFFEDLDDVCMVSDLSNFFEIVEKMEVKCGRKLSSVEMEWCEEVVDLNEEEG